MTGTRMTADGEHGARQPGAGEHPVPAPFTALLRYYLALSWLAAGAARTW
jgi:hypothetical protein